MTAAPQPSLAEMVTNEDHSGDFRRGQSLSLTCGVAPNQGDKTTRAGFLWCFRRPRI